MIRISDRFNDLRTKINYKNFIEPFIKLHQIMLFSIKSKKCIVFVFVHIYPPFTRKRIVSLYFGRDVRTRLGVAIFEVSGPPVFHIKAEASR